MPENFPRLFGFGDGREDRLISVFPLKKSLSEVLRHSVDIAEGDVDKLAPFIETALGGRRRALPRHGAISSRFSGP